MKTIIISILVAIALIGGAMWLVKNNPADSLEPSVNNVSVVDGKQIIEITAKGGYFPRVTLAKANLPTIIKMATAGTFDCSSSLVIPSLGYRHNLASSGVTEIEVSAQASGAKLQGLCSMGMYNFSVNFN
ncbi:MAG: hypothetical protein AAB589_02235 [Patescibacteria group bacterium]